MTSSFTNRRPTNMARREHADVNNSANATNGHAIIGDTAAATLYAKRLLGNHVTTPISIISEGVDRTNAEGLSDVDFTADNNLRILHYLINQKIHLITGSDNDHRSNSSDSDDTKPERIIHYRVGAGPLGDFVGAYHIPRLGPWFTHSSNGRLEHFLSESTVKFPLTSQETQIVNRLQQIWGLHATSSITVKSPSILNVHHEFLDEHEDSFVRELFLDEYNRVNQAKTVDYITEATDLKFTPVSGASGLYNITGNNVSLTSVRLNWKTDSFTFLRLATNGGLRVAPLLLPTFYRAVLSIPITGTGATGSSGATGSTVSGPSGFVCFSSSETDRDVGGPITPMNAVCFVGLTGMNGIDLSTARVTDDLITSHVTFSLYDIANPRHSSLAWLVQTYTTREDLSVIEQEGRYADHGRTLLIIEAISTKNKRRTSFDKAENEVQVNYNDQSVERGYLTQFALIVASIYNAYTGQLISTDHLLNNSSVCSATSGTCHDSNMLVDYSLRQSPMVSIVELASQLYGADIYPNHSR